MRRGRKDAAVAVPTIRAAVLPADADGLAGAYVSSAAHHARLDPGFYRVPSLAAVTARYRSGPAGTRPDLLVAELDGRIIGMAELTDLTAPGPASMITPVHTPHQSTWPSWTHTAVKGSAVS
jgi:hypothetical protein